MTSATRSIFLYPLKQWNWTELIAQESIPLMLHRNLFFFRLDNPSALSHSSQKVPPSPFVIFVALLWMLFMWTVELLKNIQRKTKLMWNALGKIACFDQLVMLCLMHPKMSFVLLDVRTHCCIMFSLLTTSTPRLLFTELLSLTCLSHSQKDENSMKGLTEMQKENICHLPFIYKCITLEGN